MEEDEMAVGPTEKCEGGCGALVYTARPEGCRPLLREDTAKALDHTAQRCRELRAKLAEKTEAKRVVRHFQYYSSEQRAHRASCHTQGHRQRQAVGEYFYTHPDVPGVAFDTRGAAARAALRVAA